MTTQEYLEQVQRLDIHIDAMLREATSLRDLATRTTSLLGDDPVTHSRDVHRSQELIARIVDMEREIDAEVDHLIDLKREILFYIAQLDTLEQRAIIALRYLQYQSWEEISDTLRYSVRHLHRLHQKALDKIEILSKDVR